MTQANALLRCPLLDDGEVVIHVICERSIIDHGDLLHRVGEMSFPHRVGRGEGAFRGGDPDRGDKGWSPKPTNRLLATSCRWPRPGGGCAVQFCDFH